MSSGTDGLSITDEIPAEYHHVLRPLRLALDYGSGAGVPPRQLDTNLVVGTWNIRAFGGLTRKWRSQAGDSPKRDLLSLLAIAEIVSRFDVIALQEVKGNLAALRELMRWLNHIEPSWSFILTDVTAGQRGNDERLAFLFDTRRVQLSGLAAEIVIPPDYSIPGRGALTPDEFAGQFARTPYAVAFRTRDRTFVLVSLHVLWGSGPAERLGELEVIAHWLMNWARDEHRFDHNLIALGDFNIDRFDDPLYRAFVSTGLQPPQALWDVPRTIFGTGGTAKHYDQIAWFGGGGLVPALSSLRYVGNGGYFDFLPHLQPTFLDDRGAPLTKSSLSWRISDHYPLWVEFAIERPEDRELRPTIS